MSGGPSPEQARLAPPMRDRWSPVVLDPDRPVDPADLELCLEAARWSPSAGNTQPWAFVVVHRGADGWDDLVASLSRGNLDWVPSAPVVVLAAVRVARAPGEEKDVSGHAAYDLGQAVAHLTLQATALGLATHQIAGFDRAALGPRLGLPEWWALWTGVALGHRGDPERADPRNLEREGRARVRRPLAETVHAGRWGEPWSAG